MEKKLSTTKLLLLDCDGVLTDGCITYSDSGEQTKNFNSRDGLGLRLLIDAGVGVGIITGRKSKALAYRCENLGITLVFDGIKDKATVLDTIVLKTGIAAEEMAFIGDDLIDLPAMKKVGIAICVLDAPDEVKAHCDIITTFKGGHGAVREICEAILKAKGLWSAILDKYTS